MEEPRKEENQNAGEEKQNQSSLPVRSCMLMCLAGIYLLYTGYKLCKNVIDGVDGGAWYFMVAGIAFLVIGAGMLFYGGKNVIKDDKEKRAKEAEEKARLAKEAAAAGNGKKSISDFLAYTALRLPSFSRASSREGRTFTIENSEATKKPFSATKNKTTMTLNSIIR